jgi:uncharacterized protein (TIGR03000 family)
MSRVGVRVALCAALVLASVSAAAAEEPAARGRCCAVCVHPPTPEARLYFEGTLLPGTGPRREFRSPVLEAGKRYTYTVVAVWVENGREVTHEMRVAFRAGDDVVVDFRR